MAKKKVEKVEQPEDVAPVTVNSIKGFEHDMTCRGHKFEFGQTYSVELDRDLLDTLNKRRPDGMMTYVIRNTLVMSRKWPPSLETRQVLRACRRLEALGHVTEKASSYVVQKCWGITDAGRAALAEKDK